MIKYTLLLFIAAVSIVGALSLKGDGSRLIAFNETYSVWMTEEEVANLRSECGAGRGFVDITNQPEFGKMPYTAKFDPNIVPNHEEEVKQYLKELKSENIEDTVVFLSGYTTRYYTSTEAVNAADQIYAKYKGIADSYGPRASVNYFQHSWAQPSIIARIEGSSKPDEVIILGGHIDSIAAWYYFSSPGADDDGSGTACVLEAFRVLVEGKFDPARTIEFHGYSAEEVGLLGSGDIAKSYADAGKNVIAMMQLDMTSYVKPNTKETIGIITDYTDGTLNQFVRLLVDTYCSIPWTNSECGYGCSDHASWTGNNYPASFPFETIFTDSNPNIHTSSDTTAYTNFKHALEFAKLGVSFIIEMSYFV